jgi:citrate synthase
LRNEQQSDYDLDMQFDQSREIPGEKAKSIISEIVEDGTLILSRHAKERMAERGYTLQDVIHILLHGEIVKKEYKEKTQNWTYRVQGYDLENDEGTIVVAIIKRMSAIVITVLG